MNKLKINGTQDFMGKEIPIIEGGFGEDKKVVLAKTISEIHKTELSEINRKINEHIDEFETGVDLLDLKGNSVFEMEILHNGLYTQNALNRAKNIYLLSEQGYMLLVGFMKTEKAKEIRKQLRREYFAMREVINSDEQLKAKLLLDIYNGGQEGVVASKQLAELEKKPLLETIEIQKPKVNWYDDFMNSNGLYTSTQVAKLFKFKSAQQFNKVLNENRIIFKQGKNWLPYSEVDKTWFKILVGEKEGHNYSNLKITPKGIMALSKILKIEINKTDLQQLA
jgi:phage antirepressor YoqD-like protein|nr:MAG TPA_asm: antirepressor protein [Caudoviricetes sp.]